MKVVITDYQYENIDSERSIITGAGYELFDYQVQSQHPMCPHPYLPESCRFLYISSDHLLPL